VRLAAVIALAVVLVPAALAGSGPSQSSLETELVCQTCHETLDQSSSPQARQMKAEIRRRIAEGWTKQQILDEMVANYGDSVLSTPATHGFDLLAWILPLGGIVGGAAGLAGGAWLWSRKRSEPGPEPPALAAEDERRVDAALARFDA
jgi:cytochrome c-type biogenesis protein CcmH